ncbi:putative Zn-dependent peptidase [Caldicellulosiruptor bescii]|uniref:Processing peptidase n=2 Tax=Caldicellulosiruptor bescii TaxID=31899 RepID=B9MS63_CALBD|nr:pitrilysin family protein [Caldicellulosiruptor bescii]ACM60517.1 processing peptidase [Caldicellulosiruptor bescii DSM 6725]PBC87928.1 putative Zn-dependent peptidase [Caldicellulosiruptor bescii]PBC90860.1 putative Zn-dependent peptidase [Caldicellulosiruptor bescii]PBD03708.1 putative Zn-dependent peptidase [Caldicellulosiruptor bescii]PBD06658.1 putative Zn-dependent peptidase [Caldicellulosiruptor bescii]
MIKLYTLSNGIRLVYEKIDTVKTASIGIWVLAGSRYETKKINGISHFIEHILFKGTKNRSSREIVYEIESIGGQINAFTAKEYTCFYVRVLDEFLQKGFDILSDLILNPVIALEEMEKEKTVIIEEINMTKEDPEEILYQSLNDLIWKNQTLSYPIIGKESTVKKIDRNKIENYMRERYIPQNIVISVAGNFEEEKLVEFVEMYFGDWKCSNNKKDGVNFISKPVFNRGAVIKNKKVDQAHMAITFEGFGQEDEKVYELLVLSNILGGGMSSRLFQRIREELGLVYSITSFVSTFKDAGVLIIYAGTNPKNISAVYKEIMSQLRLFLRGEILLDEVEVAKQQIKGSIIFGLENTSSRMSNMGKNMLLLNKIMELEHITKIIDSIDYTKVIDTAREVLSKEFSVAVVGNKKEMDLKIFEQRVLTH